MRTRNVAMSLLAVLHELATAQSVSTFTLTHLDADGTLRSRPGKKSTCMLVGALCTVTDDTSTDPPIVVHGRARRLGEAFGVCNQALECVVSMPTCNDGTPYVYYKHLNASSPNWVVFLMGGGYCYDDASCIDRKKTVGYATSSHGFKATRVFSHGIMSGDDNQFANWNRIFLPYCTSDAFSGTAATTKGAAGFSFLGKYVVPAVLNDLVQNQGLVDSVTTTFVLSGSSAGGVSIYSNIALVSESLPLARTLAIVDSGWFLDSDPFVKQRCTTAMECTEQGIFRRGAKYWEADPDPACAAHFAAGERWRCYLGEYVAPFIRTPMFIFQWKFDLAQLHHDGITANPSSTGDQLQYAQKSAVSLMQSFQQADTSTTQHHFFSPSCYYHTVLNRLAAWTSQTAAGVTFSDALRQFVSDPTVSLFKVDACSIPGCNSNCPVLKH